MRKEKDPDYQEAADYLEKFLSCLMFSECTEETLPYLDGRAESYSTEGEFNWSYAYQACPCVSARESCNEEEPGLFVGCCFQKPPKSKATQARIINIHVVERKNYGTGAYPLMVWQVLQEKPQTQNQIAKAIWEKWDAKIDRKAVGRHLKLLEDLGYPVQVCPEGYSRGEEKREPRTDLKYTASAYPFLIRHVLDDTPKTKTAIIRAVQGRFGVKMDRKAVDRNLELLDAMGYAFQKCEAGYHISR